MCYGFADEGGCAIERAILRKQGLVTGLITKDSASRKGDMSMFEWVAGVNDEDGRRKVRIKNG